MGHQKTLLGASRAGAPSRKVLRLHKTLHKAESSALTQVRTGQIGLAAFLNKVRVPDYPSPTCRCGQAQETAAHIIAHCALYTEARRYIADRRTGRVDIRALTNTAEGAARLAKWLIRLRILPQFSLADELIYGAEGELEQP